MIIHDDNSEAQPSSPTKSSISHLPAALPLHRRQSSPEPAPPSYAVATSTSPSTPGPTSPLLPHQPGSNARANRIHPQAMSQSYHEYTAFAVDEHRRAEIRRRTRSRFCKALCVALLCYVLFMAFIGSTIHFDIKTVS